MQMIMATKLARLTHKIALQLHLVAESSTIWSSRPRRPVLKFLDTPSYVQTNMIYVMLFIRHAARISTKLCCILLFYSIRIRGPTYHFPRWTSLLLTGRRTGEIRRLYVCLDLRSMRKWI